MGSLTQHNVETSQDSILDGKLILCETSHITVK